MADEQTTESAPARQTATPSIPREWLDELERKNHALSKAEAEIKRLSAADADVKQTVAALNEKVALSEKEKADLAAARERDRIVNEARDAARDHDAIRPEVVVKLLADDLKIVDGQVVASDGSAVGDYVKKYLADNLYLVKPRMSGGSGASPFPQAAPSAPAQTYDLTTAEGMTAYARSLTYGRSQP